MEALAEYWNKTADDIARALNDLHATNLIQVPGGNLDILSEGWAYLSPAGIAKLKAPETDITGWALVERQLDKAKNAHEEAQNEEDFQGVGMLCREVLISLAQAVYDPEKHPSSLDDKEIGKADTNLQLGAFIAVEFPGKEHKTLRKQVKACLDTTLALHHRRTADERDSALCIEVTASLVRVISIISGSSVGQRSSEPFRLPRMSGRNTTK